jgi:hypothetical protein
MTWFGNFLMLVISVIISFFQQLELPKRKFMRIKHSGVFIVIKTQQVVLFDSSQEKRKYANSLE